jgi:threonylcarbamoyladenosine tRNA methylthiotransferase MtaB
MVSKPVAEVAQDIRRRCDAGIKEVVLCGIHLGAYGLEMQNGTNLANLLHALRAVPLPRLRLSSIEPMDISQELIAEISDHPALCHHLHLPLQSGDDSVLAAMARGYILDDYRRRVEQVRAVWPDLSLTTDIMIGFPGESDAAFENTLAAVREFDFSRVHVFRFSPRPGTPAAIMNHQVPEKIKRERSEALTAEADTFFQRRARKLQGEVVEVLFEQKNPASGRWEGLTQHYIRVETESDKPLAGELSKVKISAAEKNILLGGLLD